MRKRIKTPGRTTIGLDLGDRVSDYCVLDGEGNIIEEGRIATTPGALTQRFGTSVPVRIAMEVGTHSPWASRLLKGLGHEVLVANARKLRMIFENRQKADRVDARLLARVARFDAQLLSTLEHRTENVAVDLAVIRARDALLSTRTRLVNHVRGAVKSSGARVARCSTERFASAARLQLPDSLRQSLSPVLDVIAEVTAKIGELDAHVEKLAAEKYPDTRLLSQLPGIAALTALTFVLTLERPERFHNSRAVGSYLGLVPARRQSGKADPQLRITKEGDMYLRRLLVQAAQRLLRRTATDCDLRRFGLRLAERGGKNAKKRAVVAVARKLAVVMHRLWRTGEVYEPVREALAPVSSTPICSSAA